MEEKITLTLDQEETKVEPEPVVETSKKEEKAESVTEITAEAPAEEST